MKNCLPSPASLPRVTGDLAPRPASAFSLVEVLLVTVLLSLILLALMAVFNSTQTAFRSSITQTDVLEGGRATMDLLATDLRQMVPSGGWNLNLNRTAGLLYNYAPSSQRSTTVSPLLGSLVNSNAVNFWLSDPEPTVQQALVGSSQIRTNLVQSIFILSRQNDLWKGVGYFVDTQSTNGVYPLYRFDSSLMQGRPTPWQIFTTFITNWNTLPVTEANTNVHHLVDGVLGFNLRAYSPTGVWLTNNFPAGANFGVTNATFYNQAYGEYAFYMCSNTLPASVDIQLDLLEDRTLQRAANFPMNSLSQSNYLAQQAGKLHVFRQRVTIPSVDNSAY